MNKINVQQTGGFPLETDTLNAMQNAYDIFNSLGNIIAPLAIVKGCEIVGNTVANGVVYIDGEVLEFRGGQAGATVIIREETKSKNFENGENKVVYLTRYATFGSSVQNINYQWVDFYRAQTIKQIEEKLNDKTAFEKLAERVNKLEVFARPFVTGFGAVLFLRPLKEIPEGWEEVTDLRGRMPIGLNPDDNDFNYFEKTGGRKSHTVTKSNLPSNLPSQVLTFNGTTPTALGVKTDTNFWVKTESLAGNNEAINLLNPYRIVIFIKPII